MNRDNDSTKVYIIISHSKYLPLPTHNLKIISNLPFVFYKKDKNKKIKDNFVII